jgi:16S rRNA (cytidine1402-2'-O)-methyltransferase
MARAERDRRAPSPADPPSTPGSLFIVATPIGNLEDITLRALRTLREVQLVAAEDTRRTAHLLRHYSISKPLVSLHEHNEARRIPELLAELRAGKSIALVTDAGTPGISDPGAQIVRAARAASIPIVPVPGPTAIATVASIAGLETTRFAFGGFPPVRSNDRNRWFAWVASLSDVPVIFFESPHRLHRTLADCSNILVDRPIIIARELTKLHEEFVTGDAKHLTEYFQNPKGEFVLVALPSSTQPAVDIAEVSDERIRAIFGQITERVGGRRQALKQTAARLRIPTKAVFAALERTKESGK